MGGEIREFPFIPLAEQASIKVRWGYYSSTSLVLIWFGWLCGLVVPLTIILTDGLFSGNTAVVNGGAMVFILIGYPLINYFCVSQAGFAVLAYDQSQVNRFRGINQILDEWMSESTSNKRKSACVKELVAGYEDYLGREKEVILRRLHTVRCCGVNPHCRFSLWSFHYAFIFGFIVFMVIPLAVFIPLSVSKLDLGYHFDLGAFKVVIYVLVCLLAVVYLARVLMLLYQLTSPVKRAYEASKQKMQGLRGRNMGEELIERQPVEIVNGAQGRVRNIGYYSAKLVQLIPGWIHREVFFFWLLLLTPITLGLGLVQYYEKRSFPSYYVESHHVKKVLQDVTYLFCAVFLGSFLLLRSISPEFHNDRSAEDRAKYITRELHYLRICKRNRWPIETMGDYPHFSTGEGIITKGVYYGNRRSLAILISRLHFNFVVFGLIPIIVSVITFPLAYNFSAVTIAVVCIAPFVCFAFYIVKSIISVTPTRRYHAIPWLIAWVLGCWLVPFLIGGYTVQVDGARAVGVMFLLIPTLVVISIIVAQLYMSWTAFIDWVTSLEAWERWVIAVSSRIWKVAFVAGFLFDIILLILGVVLFSKETSLFRPKIQYTSVAGIALLSNLLEIVGILTAIWGGVLRWTHGVHRFGPTVSMTFRWVIAVLAVIILLTRDRDTSLSKAWVHNVDLVIMALVLVLIGLRFVYGLYLYDDFLTKKRLGYFIEGHESGRKRPVVEQASKVVYYPTDVIIADLRSRGLLELEARDLMKLYLDPGTTELEKLSLKNRMVRLDSRRFPSLEELQAMLEEAIAEDVRRINSHQDVVWESRKNNLAFREDSSTVMRQKFQLSVTVNEMLKELHGLEEHVQKKVALKQEREAKRKKRKERFEYDEYASSEEDSDSIDDAVNQELDLEQTCDDVDLVAHYADHPHLRAFEISRGSTIRERIRYRKQYYKHLDSIILIDGLGKRLIFVDYSVGLIVRVPFAWIQEVRWYPTSISEKTSVQVDITIVTRLVQKKCSTKVRKTKPRAKLHVIHFETPEERERFCLYLYSVACVHGVEHFKAREECMVGLFAFDNNQSVIYQICDPATHTVDIEIEEHSGTKNIDFSNSRKA
uniref:Uncharacterized protein n=1 Tax=Mucochytrium quahogii TaxID=96639 RepID=A0A7S2S738_9STRA|mmetsp:Transcript_25700/g.55784  ORF Transcript_25700/g.55784 Transcript_25700/m.55784 type:complete len:1098 (+) Transcript_25700:399-3692(+)|eukprot:CAMPEP_0203756306 /NCGR_PEP_ID=MMETSP0098-20131031/9606_1 /ASSEMBLY_ACC=CAM_ASM_000208 /TAXON_ID=96639 /ORGANISM=" , Strain NY0313808BC1" /LENGTH=1097 /DNA_ID=CAMNT_0050648135 /DNA_START=359 /DNA_END=3652 /DNA_ORIENTATION=-